MSAALAVHLPEPQKSLTPAPRPRAQIELLDERGPAGDERGVLHCRVAGLKPERVRRQPS